MVRSVVVATTMIAKLMVNSNFNPRLTVAALDKILPDNYLCLVESNKQQIKEIRSKIKKSETFLEAATMLFSF